MWYAAKLMKPLYVLLAAKGHAPPPLVDIDWTVFIQFGIFMVLLVILSKFVFGPWLAIQQERDDNIDGAKSKANDLDGDADEKIANYEDKLIVARKEAAGVRAEFRKEAEGKAGEVLRSARGMSEKKVKAARQKLAADSAAAQVELSKRADEIASAIATRLLGREV